MMSNSDSYDYEPSFDGKNTNSLLRSDSKNKQQKTLWEEIAEIFEYSFFEKAALIILKILYPFAYYYLTNSYRR